MDETNDRGSELPEFSDMKMFIDSLLINYQTEKTMGIEIERYPMICTPVRRDFLFGKREEIEVPDRCWLWCYFRIWITSDYNNFGFDRFHLSYPVSPTNWD